MAFIEKMPSLEYNNIMDFSTKKFMFFGYLFCSLSLFACSKKPFFYDNQAMSVNVPIAKMEITNIVDISDVSKYDQKSLIPTSIKKGVEHQIVISIQSRLMELGYMDEDKPTSYFGESTEAAIKKFERQLGFKEDGICTGEIYKNLMKKDAVTYEVRKGIVGDDIKILKEQLYELNYILYESDINSYFDEKTENAVIELQKSNKLIPTGKIDLLTLRTMYNENVVAYTINKKSSKDIIKYYQEKLKTLGYYFGPCDGVYTDDFRISVREFQKDNSQITDGYIGPSTKFMLDSEYAKPFIIYMGQSNKNVRELQNRLVKLNYLSSDLATGYYGEYTAQAVAIFQIENNLPMTGIVDGLTNVTIRSEEAKMSSTGPLNYLKESIMNNINTKKPIYTPNKVGTVEDLLKVAKLKLGSKYVRGSRGPNTFDCSGFVYWCLNQIGVNINYMTTYGWCFSTQFEKVEKFEDLKTGDLIIISGHMGIVDENETIIDASSSNGKVVHRDLDEWWRERFIIGFRVFSDEKKLEVK